MVHNCIDWTTTPPTRKTPLLIITLGNDHVYTPVPKEFKTLKEVAKKEFHLDDHVDLEFSSSCMSLCHGHPARITEDAWGHLSSYIGCATVEISQDRQTDERESGAKRKVSSPDAVDQLHAYENDQLEETLGLAVRDVQDTTSDNGMSTPEDEERWEEELGVIRSPRPRVRRRVASEDEEEREPNMPPRSPLSPAASPPRLTQPGKEIKKERLSERNPSAAPESGNARSHSETEYDTQTQTESGETNKLMIRVAHRPSRQESKFMAKGTTKVAKVLAGACKSFGLDPSRASMYLIVSVDDEDGQVENLFPCDKSDTISRAGAERDTESRFLLKLAGEA